VEAFQRFEDHVLPLMSKHGGHLERRLRSADSLREIHVVFFPSPDALQQYMDDPERRQHLHLREASGATSELIEMTTVPD
jgi:uncharacterized protein (DUF1330 family)